MAKSSKKPPRMTPGQRTIQQTQQRIEIFLNEQRADLNFFKVIVQCFLLNTMQNSPHAAALVADLKAQVLRALAYTEISGEDVQGSERLKQLTILRAEGFFLELEEALGIPETKDGPSALS